MMPKANISDQDLMQAMLARIGSYMGSSRDLQMLVADLDGLFTSISNHEAWEKEFRKEWGILEEINALILDDSPPDQMESQRLVGGALIRLEDMIKKNLEPDQGENK